MRPKNQLARDQLATVMARQSAASAADLAQSVGVSVPTLHRLLLELGDQVVATGKARRTRYALRRALRGQLNDLPVYEVGPQGRAELMSSMALVHPQGTCMNLADTVWPVLDEARDGWWDGLPYLLQDMRPRGYMGRQFARAEHRQLAVPASPEEWNDDDVLWVLSQRGLDASGNLIVGDASYEQWQHGKTMAPDPIASRALGRAYEELAAQAVALGVAGSSAGGEFPKFPALRDLKGSDTPHVLVKFSGADRSAAVRRWSDLLVCEHLALECASAMPEIQSARSRIAEAAGRTFLEVERFDRHGLHGRSALISLSTIDYAWLGDGSTDWTRLAARLVALGWLSNDDELRIQRLWWFGRLIANSDMHSGNLSFRPQQGEGHALALAPAYDMLPMLYAPLRAGEVPEREFEPPLPLPTQRAAWLQACEAALAFWTGASTDTRIGAGFRRICKANAHRLQELAQHV